MAMNREERYALQWRLLRLGMFALALIGGFFAYRGIGDLWGRLRSSLPEGWNANPHLLVELPPGIELRPGTPLVRVEPRLELLGEVQRAARPEDLGGGDREVHRGLWYVSVRPAAFEGIREDTRLAYSGRALELMEIFEAYLDAERLQGLAAELAVWVRDHRADMELLRDTLWARLAARYGAEDARRLLDDPVLRSVLLGVLRRQLLEQVDWPEVVDELAQGQAAEEIGTWLGSSLQVTPLLGAAADALLAQVLDELWQPVMRAIADPVEFTGDVTREVVIFTLRWASGQSTAEQAIASGHRAWRGLRSGVARAGESAGEAAKRRALEQLQEAWSDDPDRVLGMVGTLGAELGAELELEERLLAVLRELSGDPAVAKAFARFGADAQQRLAAALAETWRDAEVQAAVGRLARSLGTIAGRVVREAVLDSEGDGWNPMVLALLREKMLGKRTPMLIVETPGAGASVASGSVFQVRITP